MYPTGANIPQYMYVMRVNESIFFLLSADSLDRKEFFFGH